MPEKKKKPVRKPRLDAIQNTLRIVKEAASEKL